MPLVEKRYAEALVDIAAQAAALDEYQQQLGTIAGLFGGQPEFRVFLLNPEVKSEDKKRAIKSIFSGKIENELFNFLMLLIDKGRIGYLKGISREFEKLADERKNVLNMTIISALPLDKDQIDQISEKYRKLYNAYSVKAVVETDKGLIGGVKVKIGDKVIDGSVKGRIEGLKELLAGSL